jgi:hypothetical protein
MANLHDPTNSQKVTLNVDMITQGDTPQSRSEPKEIKAIASARLVSPTEPQMLYHFAHHPMAYPQLDILEDNG